MKKVMLLFAVILWVGSLSAQTAEIKKKPKVVLGGDGIYLRDSIWKVGGFLGATISQTALYQWGPGGTNSFAILLSANAYANYKKDKIVWDNSLDAKWGLVANGLIRKSGLARRNFQKNIDLLSFKSNFGYEITKQLYVSARLGFESQFTPSYDYSQTDTANGAYRKLTVSKFAAPAILTIGPGITWKPKEWFTLSFSPATGKMTFVTKDSPMRSMDTLPDGRFTDRYYKDVDETRFGLLAGKGFMGEFGAELDILFQKEVVKNVSIESRLKVFSAYLNPNFNTTMPKYYEAEDSLGSMTISSSNLHIPVVRWDNDLVFKVNKFLSATLSARFVYQYNATVPIDKRTNGTGAKGADGVTDIDKFDKSITAHSKLQIFEQFGVGLSFKF
ncbi:MAG: DUF3078 domain-containing protein [Bacteroidetes bacterium]|nr:DUF3078 domain-containing protein [Bacteroidota bacterium]